MTVTIVSDLHLGILSGADVARLPAAHKRLLEAVSGADHVVLLGDLLELRERRMADMLRISTPIFRALGEVTAGRRLTIVPGNHDHQLAEPWLAGLRLDGGSLTAESAWPVERGHGALGRIADLMPSTQLTLAYPGIRLRDDVYATHGHYLDLHLKVPRIESIAAKVMGRLTGRGQACRSAADYEAVLGPMYAFLGGLPEGATPNALRRSGRISRRVWLRASGPGRSGKRLITGAAIPAAVATLNRVGLGPLGPGISGEDLRREGLVAMRQVADVLAPGAGHVVFGHTHRPGPLAGEDGAEWTSAAGIRLWNSGSWCHESAFLGPPEAPGPYWPGTVVQLGDDGPPRIENVLRGVEMPDYAA